MLRLKLNHVSKRGHGSLFNKGTYVLPYDLMKSRSHKSECYDARIALNFDRYFSSTALLANLIHHWGSFHYTAVVFVEWEIPLWGHCGRYSHVKFVILIENLMRDLRGFEYRLMIASYVEIFAYTKFWCHWNTRALRCTKSHCYVNKA